MAPVGRDYMPTLVAHGSLADLHHGLGQGVEAIFCSVLRGSMVMKTLSTSGSLFITDRNVSSNVAKLM